MAARTSRLAPFAPEVVQTSSMDCGPAVLKCLAEGCGLRLDYGRLREACQTDVDGTSIDTLEALARRLGLDVEQVLLPADHLLVPGVPVLPAIVVTRQEDGTPHFVVAWSRLGPRLQLMDPAAGRRWPAVGRFLDELYLHRTVVGARAWRRWAAGAEYRAGLVHRLTRVGLPAGAAARALDDALATPGWRAVAALDAATRMTRALIDARALDRGPAARRLVAALVERERAGSRAIPPTYWPAVEDAAAVDGEPGLRVRGAVLLRLRARPARAFAPPDEALPELVAARGPAARPGRALARRLGEAAGGSLVPLALAVALSAATVIAEAVLLRGLLQVGGDLDRAARAVYLGGVLAFLALLLALELPLALGLARLGRRLEVGLRRSFLEKLPRLGSRYFRSRPVSDMSERAHSLHALRQLPGLGANLLRGVLHVAFTAGALVWLDPHGAPLIALAALLALALPFAGQRLLGERELRVRSHLGALGRFTLDGLLGLVPVRTHGAERAMRREHAALLERWLGAGLRFQRAVLALEAVQGVVALGLSFAILWDYRAGGGDPAGALLVVYWSLGLPVLGQEVARLLAQAPLMRTVALRALEPLGALEETGFLGVAPAGAPAPAPAAGGATLAFRALDVRRGARRVLADVTLEVGAGEHVAVVGPSGAGKSTLLGCLLGWHRPADGTLAVDGAPLDAAAVRHLRARTAWVDASVRLWNRPLAANLAYGAPPPDAARTAWAIERAELARVVDALPGGLDGALGEGGALVSGGEGQRVRLARALLRPGVRLALLDEPLRGLERAQRRALLARARAHWKDATLLCVTHDLEETLAFDRVLVVEDGRLVEDGAPATLAARAGSRYRALLDAERALDAQVWDAPVWRRLRLEEGRLVAAGPRS